MKTTIPLLMALLIWTIPVSALQGYAEIDYNLFPVGHTDEVTAKAKATLSMWKGFGNWTIGGKLIGELRGFGNSRIIPGGIPIRQYYEGFITYHASTNIDLTVSSWCWHWFSLSGLSGAMDTGGLSVKMRYNF